MKGLKASENKTKEVNRAKTMCSGVVHGPKFSFLSEQEAREVTATD